MYICILRIRTDRVWLIKLHFQRILMYIPAMFLVARNCHQQNLRNPNPGFRMVDRMAH
jgi:hypothetical protein